MIDISSTYIPSRLLLKALSQPLPRRCSLSRNSLVHFTHSAKWRGVRSNNLFRAGPVTKEKLQLLKEMERQLKETEAQMENEEQEDRIFTDEELEDPRWPEIRYYEEDIAGGQRRLVDVVKTAEDRKRINRMEMMVRDSYKNPSGDQSELKKMIWEDMMKAGELARWKQEDVDEMKEWFVTPEKVLENLEQETIKMYEEHVTEPTRKTIHEAIQVLIDEPRVHEGKDELRGLQQRLSSLDSFSEPDFQNDLDRVIKKINSNEEYQRQMMIEAGVSTQEELEKIQVAQSKTTQAIIADIEKYEAEVEKKYEEYDKDLDELNSLDDDDFEARVKKMDSMLRKHGVDVDAELAEHDGPKMTPETDAEIETAIEIVADILDKETEKARKYVPSHEDTNTDNKVPAEIDALVDEILTDPRFVDCILATQKLVANSKSDLANYPIASAPDPATLPESQLATIAQQMKVARETPKHVEALKRLRVKLPPPFNVSPVLKTFNKAIQLAYVGGNEPIRRIVWRAYQKARALPTFLHNLSDDAWDLIYYSQAVNWETNRHRYAHLTMILADLKSIGRDGPPTHPSTLSQKKHQGQVIDI